VFFWQALDAMLRHNDLMLVEAGPGQMLSQIARRHPKVRSGRGTVVPVLPVRSGTPDQDRVFADRARVILGSA
jgi:[acyl-carrier-protein] S-malonyltransferase